MFPPNGDGLSRHVVARPARRTSYPSLSPAQLFRHEIEEVAGESAELELLEQAEDLGGDLVELELLEQEEEQGNAEGAEGWPAWTDAPVEFVDYDSFDDEGRLLQKGGA